MFGRVQSQFELRQRIFTVNKTEMDDFITYAGNVKKIIHDFATIGLTEEDMRCLVFIQGLTGSKYAELRQRLCREMEKSDGTKTVEYLTQLYVEDMKLIPVGYEVSIGGVS